MTPATSRPYSRQKRKKRLYKCLFVLVGVLLLVTSSLTCFADFAISRDNGSYIAYCDFPFSINYTLLSKTNVEHTLTSTFADVFSCYPDVSPRSVAQTTTDTLRGQVMLTSTYQRNDHGQLKGSFTQTWEATDEFSISPTFQTTAPFLMDTVDAGRPYFTVQGYDLRTNDVSWTIRYYDPDSRAVQTYTATQQQPSPDFPIYITPADFLSYYRKANPLYETVMIFSITIDPHANKQSTLYPELTFSLNGYRNATIVPVDGKFLSLPSTQWEENFTAFAELLQPSHIETIDMDFTSWLSNAFAFLNVPLFGTFTLGGLISAIVGIGFLFAFLRFFAGG